MKYSVVKIQNDDGVFAGVLIGQQWFISFVSSVKSFQIDEEVYSCNSIIKIKHIDDAIYAYKFSFKNERYALIDDYINIEDDLVVFSACDGKLQTELHCKLTDFIKKHNNVAISDSLIFNNSTQCLYGYYYNGLKKIDIEKVLCAIPELYDDQINSQDSSQDRKSALTTKLCAQKKFDINVLVRKNINSYLIRQLNVRCSLNTQLNNQTLIDAGILMNNDVVDSFGNKHNLNDLIDNEVKNNSVSKYVLMAGGGQGKTASALSVFSDLVEKYFNNEIEYLPIYIDLPNTSGIESINDEESFAKFICLAYLNNDTELKCFEADILNKIYSGKVYLITDAMDEYIGGRSLKDARAIAENKLFSDFAKLITIRSYDFKRYLTNTRFASIVNSLILLDWDEQKYNEYIHRYLTYRGYPDKIDGIKKTVNDTEAFKLMATNPLRLNMIIEVCLVNAGDNVVKLEGLYATYFGQLINREIMRFNCVEVENSDVINILKELAWLFYKKNNGGGSYGVIFENEFDSLVENNVVAENQNMIKQIIMGTQIIGIEHFSTLGRKVIRFSHNSYYEYFTSCFIVGCMMNKNIECLKFFFCHYITSVVSQFIRETMASTQFAALANDYRTEMVKPLITVFEENICTKSDEKFSEKRLARGQVAYYIGNLRTDIGRDFLIHEYGREEDAWVLRDIVFGLAFGDSSEYSDKYIDLLIEERKCGGTEKNNINIGYYLSFFGDQQFDPLDPGKDQGFPGCQNTLSRILYFLGSPEDKQAWRIHLYTLVDLFNYRKVSKDEIVGFLKCNKQTIFDRLESLKFEMGNWSFFVELQKILSELDNG